MAVLNVPQALQLLQLQPGATIEQIRAAYKRLALQLHPDKQQQSTDASAAFAELSAAYSLLVQGCCVQQIRCSQQYNQVPKVQFVPFETAYASGSLFSEELVNEAVLAGAAPADVVNLQLLMSAAAQGQLAKHLVADTPTAAEEQLWRELYTRLQLRAQARQHSAHQQQQQQAHEPGVGVADLLADLLVRPKGPLFVEVTNHDIQAADDDDSQEGSRQSLEVSHYDNQLRHVTQQSTQQQSTQQQQQQQQQQQHQDQSQPAHNASDTGPETQQQVRPFLPGGQSINIPTRMQHKQQQHGSDLPQDVLSSSTQPQQPPTQPKHQRSKHQRPMQHQLKQQQQQQQQPQKKQLRHGWAFYSMWIRRALLAKALMSVVSSSFQAQRYEHRFPKPLPLPSTPPAQGS